MGQRENSEKYGANTLPQIKKVQMALHENRWIKHLLPLQSSQEIREYVALWEQVGNVQLQEGTEDTNTIRWRWTPDGEYTTKSAYQIQFEGSYSKLRLTPIWRAQTEPKCRFFAWTLLHKKIRTANNLIKRNWPNDPTCKLCGIDPKTQAHLCKDCPYSKTSLVQTEKLAATLGY